MALFARIAVNVPSMAGVFVNAGGGAEADALAAFDYKIPTALIGKLDPGHLVVVPFANRTVQGVVLRLLEVPAVKKTKEILSLVDAEPVLTAHQIQLAEWMAMATLAPIGTVVELFLPAGLAQQADTIYSVRNSEDPGLSPKPEQAARGAVEGRLMNLLRVRGPLRGRQIDRALPRMEWRRTAQYLVRHGVLSSQSVLPPGGVRPKFIRTAQLAAEPNVARDSMAALGANEVTRNRRQKALSLLMSKPEAINVSWVYAETGCNLSDLQELAERDLIVLREQEIWRDPVDKSGTISDVKSVRTGEHAQILTGEQANAWMEIEAGFRSLSMGKPIQHFLLQGVTGSGKTELYLRAAAETVRMGREAIILVPEISLTPQTVHRFTARFPGQVGLIHSKLSEGERYDTWRRARAGSLKVIIGPRSALFAPLPQPGLMILDECHDPSYHQSEPPFYDTVAAAQTYALICGGICILGSATPSVTQRYQAEIGGGKRLHLAQRIASDSGESPAPSLEMPPVRIVDMREELKTGNRGSFSRNLKEELGNVLDRGEQAILFLNRRGTATHVFCRNCGYAVTCPRCDTPMTYHVSAGAQLVCHRCSYERQMPKRCPNCGSDDIRAYGMGTEKVEAEVLRTFPKARTLRWDFDTTRQKDSHAVILHHFAAGHADVLIGTQMLAKGLDLPRVTLVGIVLADVGLFLPDPFAVERVFQVLTQVAGRAGRSELGGRVVLQTFSPEHHAIQAVSRHDVNGFYAEELGQRRRLGYPPFTKLLRLEYRHYDAAKAEKTSRDAAVFLETELERSGRQQNNMIGPAPCFFTKIDGKFRWQIVLRGDDLGSLLEGRRFADWRIEVDPVSLL